MVYPIRNKTSEIGKRPAFGGAVSYGVYLLIGQDPQAKEIQLNKIKQEFLPQELRDFNLDVLYSKEINLKAIQEKFLSLPLKSAKRIIVIKDAQSLDEQSRDYLLNYCKKPQQGLVLVLDFEHYDYKDEFIKNISRRALVIRFQQTVNPDAFTLSRQIELKKTDLSLRLLNQLLSNGEPAEKILGGLRYAWERQNIQTLQARKKFKLLLACDIEIKTGRLKPALALEKLIVSLCGLAC